MSLIAIIGLLAIIGIVFWYIQKLSLPQPVMLVIYAVVAILAIIVIMQITGVGGSVPGLRIR